MHRYTNAACYHDYCVARKVNRILVGAVLVLTIALIITLTNLKASATESEPQTTYVVADVCTERDSVQGNPLSLYMCDGLHLACIMPDGSIHDYIVADDYPEEIPEVVVFATENQNDYTSYRIVGMR